MSKKPKYYLGIISILEELHKDFPSYNLGKHLSTALDGHGDVWGISDKELFYALDKYKTELGLDSPHNSSDQEIDEIIKGGLNLNYLMEEEDNGESY